MTFFFYERNEQYPRHNFYKKRCLLKILIKKRKVKRVKIIFYKTALPMKRFPSEYNNAL